MQWYRNYNRTYSHIGTRAQTLFQNCAYPAGCAVLNIIISHMLPKFNLNLKCNEANMVVPASTFWGATSLNRLTKCFIKSTEWGALCWATRHDTHSRHWRQPRWTFERQAKRKSPSNLDQTEGGRFKLNSVASTTKLVYFFTFAHIFEAKGANTWHIPLSHDRSYAQMLIIAFIIFIIRSTLYNIHTCAPKYISCSVQYRLYHKIL